MQRMVIARRAIFFQFYAVRMRPFVFRRRVIAVLALGTGQRHNDPHFLHLQPSRCKKPIVTRLFQRHAPFLVENVHSREFITCR